jgi:hypothetical protein
VAELLRSTAGDDDVEEVDEMLSFSGFRGLLNENLLTKRSGLGFGDKTGGLLPDLLVVSVESKDLTLSTSLFEGADELFDLGRCRLEGGVGVASGGRLLGLPLPPEITVGVWSFLTLDRLTESIGSFPFDSFRLFSKLENQLRCLFVNSLMFGLVTEVFREFSSSELFPFSISFCV